MMTMMNRYGEETLVSKLQFATRNLHTLLQTSTDMEMSLAKMDKRFVVLMENLSATSRKVAPLQSLAMSTKALDARIDRAVSPATKLIDSFKIAETLQRKLIKLSSKLPAEKNSETALRELLKLLGCVDRLNSAIESITLDCEPAIQKLQEVVEFLSRTKATDQFRTHRLRETLLTLKAIYEAEVDEMRYDGLLDAALLNLQDDYEAILKQLRHKITGNNLPEKRLFEISDLGSSLQVDVLRGITETLAKNDCLDICIDIFVKVRYRRAATALMRLNPDYLKAYSPEEIDGMEWEGLEMAIALWIQHLELAVRRVFLAEKKLCKQVFGEIMEGSIWAECFAKIADKIMAVFFRFGEGVARSSKEPQKLFKLLDMFESMEKLKGEFAEIFEGEAGKDICSRFRELQKLLVHASCKVFWEFGLQIEGNQDGFPPPQDGSVPKLVRYAINYLKYLATENYSCSMAKVLRTEQIWKAGFLSKPETDENLLRDSIYNIMEALQRNIEAKKFCYRDKVLPHIFATNTHWYIYMRTRNTELGKLLGEAWLKKKYKTVAEESAYSYQNHAWGPLVRLLNMEEAEQQLQQQQHRAVIRGKIEAFMEALDENLQKHERCYTIPDVDLREQIKSAIVKLVVPAYAVFANSHSGSALGEPFVPPDSIQGLLQRLFEGKEENTNNSSSTTSRATLKSESKGGGGGGEIVTGRRRGSLRRQSEEGAGNSASFEGGSRDAQEYPTTQQNPNLKR